MRGAPARRPSSLVFVLILLTVAAAACVGASGGAGRSPDSGWIDASDPPPPGRSGGELPPNVILVVTDDQTAASMRGAPVAMPWFRSQLDERGWTTFTNAVISTPLCCPSRATILTGRYARHTGVVTNLHGSVFDDGDTLATWLDDAGYHTAMIGKYLNGYPWGAEQVVPPAGWDRWYAKLNDSEPTIYYDYDVIDDGTRISMGHDEDDYVTDRLAAEASAFLRDAPSDRPFFLYFAPPAPHAPAEPAPRDASLLEREVDAPSAEDLAAMNDVAGEPDWIRSLDPIDPGVAAALAVRRLRERVALRAVDDALRGLWDIVAERGELDRTVWLLVSDNGYSYGDRRWVGKTCPWEVCIHVPLYLRVPGTAARTSDALVSNIDVAPTIADLAGVEAHGVDGISIAGLADRDAGERGARRPGILLEWVGYGDVPPWIGIRLPHAVWIRHADGTRELYDLATDPLERRNLVDLPRADDLQRRAERALDRSLAAVGSAG